MNTAHDSGAAESDAPAVLGEAARRRRRAGVAQCLMAAAPEAVAALDWEMLDRAPAWLALPPDALERFQCQVGAVLGASALRLWIDGPRLAAARAALGEPFLQALLAQPALTSMPLDLSARPCIETAAQVGERLRIAGASVLLAALAHGPLRRAVGAALAPAEASPLAPEIARSLIVRAQTLAANRAPTRPGAAATSPASGSLA